MNLPKQLRIKAGMVLMGEAIEWGSDAALMDQAAAEIERLQALLKLANHGLVAANTALRKVVNQRKSDVEGHPV